MKKFYNPTLLAFLLLHVSVYAGNDITTPGARAVGLANAVVTLSDGWSIHNNQAGLGFLKNTSAGAYYENRFLISELALSGGYFAMPTKFGVFGLSARSFGYQLYRESKVGVAYAKTFGPNLSIGIQLNWEQVMLGDIYGNRNGLTAEIGAQYKFNDKFKLGAHIYNPTRTSLAEFNNERLPTILRFGISYQLNKKILMLGEVEKNIYAQESFKGAIEYELVSVLFLRVGVSNNPLRNTAGFGIKLKKLQIDFAASFTQNFGFTPHFGLTYQFTSEKEN